MKKTHEFYMQQALVEAQKAFELNEVPVGAVIVNADGEVIAKAEIGKKWEKVKVKTNEKAKPKIYNT